MEMACSVHKEPSPAEEPELLAEDIRAFFRPLRDFRGHLQRGRRNTPLGERVGQVETGGPDWTVP